MRRRDFETVLLSGIYLVAGGVFGIFAVLLSARVGLGGLWFLFWLAVLIGGLCVGFAVVSLFRLAASYSEQSSLLTEFVNEDRSRSKLDEAAFHAEFAEWVRGRERRGEA